MLARGDYIVDGFSTLEAGVDTGLDARLIGPNQVSFAVNATMRGGLITCRPKFVKVDLAFFTDQLRSDFQNGLFQHFAVYRSDTGEESLLVQVSGRSWRIVPSTGAVAELTITGDRNQSNLLGGYSVQAENFWVYQDGSSGPLIYNGASLRRALPGEIQTGTVMEYSGGRIWYATNNGRTFRATDLVGGASGSAVYGYRDSVLKETENDYLNEGGDFSVPVGQSITAMRNMAQIDTSLGQGSLQVFTEEGVFSVNAPYDRTAWKSVDYPIQTVALLGYGAMSQAGTIPVNGDLFYRAKDGIRSLIMAQRFFRGWGNTPMSAEMERVIKYDQLDLLKYGSAVNFDQRLLVTCSPVYTEQGIYHRGLIALDFMRVGSMQKQIQPSYDGIWTGLRIMQLVQTRDRCFAIVLGNAHLLELWELKTERGDDDDRTPIVWQIETRKFNYGNNRNLKEVHTAEVITKDEIGSVNYTLQYRPDDYPCWLDWSTWNRCYSQCTTAPGCPTPFSLFNNGYWPKKIVEPPEEACLPIGKNALRFNVIQARLVIEGQTRIASFGIKALDRTEQSKGDCETENACVALQCCGPSIWDYDADPGDQSYYYSYWYGAGEQLRDPEPETPDNPSHEDPGTPDEPDDPENPPTDPEDPEDPEPPPPTVMGLEPFGFDPTSLGYQTWQPLFEGPESPVDPGVTWRPAGYSPAGDPPSGMDGDTVAAWMAAVRVEWAAFKQANDIAPAAETMYWQWSGGGAQLKWNAGSVFTLGDYIGIAAYEWEIWVAFTT